MKIIKNKRIIISFTLIILLLSIGCLLFFTRDLNTESNQTESFDQDTPHMTMEEKEDLIDKLKTLYPSETIYISSVNGVAGKIVKIPIFIINNPGIIGQSGTLIVNEQVMKIIDISKGEDFPQELELTISGDLGNGNARYLIDGVDISDSSITDGELLLITVELSKDLEPGKYPIKLILDNNSSIDSNLEIVNFFIENGIITID